MADRDMTEAGRAWMRGELPSADYFAMARRSAWTPTMRKRAGVWERLAMWWRRSRA